MLGSCSSKSHCIIDFSAGKAINFTNIILLEKVPEGCEDMDLPGTPFIFAIVDNPLAALAVWYSSFFMFNLQYQPKAPVLSKFVQRCFFEISLPSDWKQVYQGQRWE
ncbi:hypothetical protein HOLleu_19694 [Holothuria leucospilota]|uniref:Uncharacterized protein n=1 Tax=Holothuria leucospilota TaxID=206669 RepID=A0A9Q1H841_HOLLE|nr:hypothetical protein HOLleu_19694 [Holothuria leucospilota]